MRRQTLHKKAHKSAHRRVPCKHSHLFVFTSFEPITTYHNQNKTKKANVQISFHDDRFDVDPHVSTETREPFGEKKIQPTSVYS